MATTSHMAITLVEQSQAQKEVTVNEAFAKFDAILNTGAVDKDLATPPGAPSEGDVYIVAASATGDWAGMEGQIAYYNQIWRFIAPLEGMSLWVSDEDRSYTYDGTNWTSQLNLTTNTQTCLTTASSGTALSLDIAIANIHDVTLDDNCTFSFTNPPASGIAATLTLILRQDATGGRSTTWPASVIWPGGSAPTLTTTSSATDILEFTTLDAGATWFGYTKGLDLQ